MEDNDPEGWKAFRESVKAAKQKRVDYFNKHIRFNYNIEEINTNSYIIISGSGDKYLYYPSSRKLINSKTKKKTDIHPNRLIKYLNL